MGGRLKLMTLGVGSNVAFESRIAWRKVPGPEFAWLVTLKVSARKLRMAELRRRIRIFFITER